jgi:hypothetical protein
MSVVTPRYVQHAGCPFCGAKMGEPCVTRTGNRPKEVTHAARFHEMQNRVRTEHMVYELLVDDERCGLKEGDRLLCIRYPYDQKVTVVQRLSDGFDPECNMYLHDVMFIGFAKDIARASIDG